MAVGRSVRAGDHPVCGRLARSACERRLRAEVLPIRRPCETPAASRSATSSPSPCITISERRARWSRACAPRCAYAGLRALCRICRREPMWRNNWRRRLDRLRAHNHGRYLYRIATVPTRTSDAFRRTRSTTPDYLFICVIGDDFGIGQRRYIAFILVVRDRRQHAAHDLAGTGFRHVGHDHDTARAGNGPDLADHEVL